MKKIFVLSFLLGIGNVFCMDVSDSKVVHFPGTDRYLDLLSREPLGGGLTFLEIIEEDENRAEGLFEIAEIESSDSLGGSVYQHFYAPTFRKWFDEKGTNPLTREKIDSVNIRYYLLSLPLRKFVEDPSHLLEGARRALARKEYEKARNLLKKITISPDIDPTMIVMAQSLLDLIPVVEKKMNEDEISVHLGYRRHQDGEAVGPVDAAILRESLHIPHSQILENPQMEERFFLMGEKPYTCYHPGCGYKCLRQSDLCHHMKMHVRPMKEERRRFFLREERLNKNELHSVEESAEKGYDVGPIRGRERRER